MAKRMPAPIRVFAKVQRVFAFAAQSSFVFGERMLTAGSWAAAKVVPHAIRAPRKWMETCDWATSHPAPKNTTAVNAITRVPDREILDKRHRVMTSSRLRRTVTTASLV
jgi:hypothetical protein